MKTEFWRIMTTPLEELTIEELEFGANHTDNSVTSKKCISSGNSTANG